MTETAYTPAKQRFLKRSAKIFLAVLLVLIFICMGIFTYYGVRYPDRYGDIITRESSVYGVDPNLVRGIIWAESKFNPKAESGRGAKGLMQLMPKTAEWCAQQLGIPYEDSLLTDADTNIRLGTFYINYLLNKFDEPFAVAAYNAGEGRVAGWTEAGLSPEQFPYRETRDYVKRVVSAQKVYRWRAKKHA